MMHQMIPMICALLIAAPITLWADDVPFVAGFERFHRPDESDSGGRLLLTELSCTACHVAGNPALSPKRGPNLDGVGIRLQTDWVKRFLKTPQVVKHGTTMPDVLAGLPDDEKERAVSALLAFLATQRSPFRVLKSTGSNPIAHEFWRKGDARRGQLLYHQVGCVACHEPHAEYTAGEKPPSPVEQLLAQLDPEELKELGLADAARPVASVPHPDLPTKYTRKSLTHFLLAPHTIRPAGRMPELKLTPDEAADITAWLLREQPRLDRPLLPESDNAELIDTGKRLFTELRCGNCHAATGIKEALPARPLAKLNPQTGENCIGSPQRGLPHFPVDKVQRAALQTELADLPHSDSTAADEVSEDVGKVAFAMQQLNCYACHVRDGRGGVGPKRREYFEIEGHVDLGDEGRLPPPLDGVGRKLRSKWLQKVLAGDGDVRPHMLTRMPKFGRHAVESLPAQFLRADLPTRQNETDVFGKSSTSLTEAGRQLLDTGCVQCHPLRGEQLPGVVGIDLAGIAGRLQPQWFHDFLRNPGELKARTRMPTFFPNGKSANQEILSGNMERQIAAMWWYLKNADTLPLPEKIEAGKVHSFELIPHDRPLLLRTFMNKAGPHAIAVGFPKKVHLAFDAEAVRLAQMWRGRFLDAHGTWFDRFTPPADPLGTDVIALPAGPLLMIRPAPDRATQTEQDGVSEYQFRGYRLDRAGVPTFLYRFAGIDVEDRLQPAKDGSFLRQLRLSRPKQDSDGQTDGPTQLRLRAQAGQRLERTPSGGYVNEDGLTVSFSAGMSDRGKIENIDDRQVWTLPVSFDESTVIEMRYQW